MTVFLRTITIVLLAFLLWSCTDSSPVFVPVEDATSIERVPMNGLYRVRNQETLYSIAWRYGLDYRDLALRNGLNPAARLHAGQIIYLRGKSPQAIPAQRMVPSQKISMRASQVLPRPVINKNYFESAAEPRGHVGYWVWPARGRVIGYYSGVNKGINIAGESGDPVYAAAAGKVVYSGHGLRSYGNLIIIKHNSTFLTAYAHNRKNLVSEGQWVKSGQVIAQIGHTGSRQNMLHFEIRRGGVPVNPEGYLTSR